ncbi:MAG: Guanine deaminase [uncultured Truepera sp.]|uniref:Guanine deaminase n=1 Tax=uncultured Truepera sp. TaxID=543023 RepID=A0A6J4VUY4_9DEIN|nr:MAG: Guanine deaminase [uncultured Truepera sp.]
MTIVLRARIFHTPRDPFREAGALETVEGALALTDDRVGALGSLTEVQRQYPDAPVLGDGEDYLLPGFVDTHVHYPQMSVVGAMGLTLLDWLRERTLPEEARLADTAYAREVAARFLRALARNGTTTALVFGAHQPPAQGIFFELAAASGLRITSGLVLGDRLLHPALEADPETCYRESETLLRAWHKRGRVRYAVTPRFSVSCSEGVLEAAGALLRSYPDAFFQTHLNEAPAEISAVAELFPWARDYLETYERFGLVTERSLFAHNVHVTGDELTRLAAARSAVAHCPSSNMFIGSGLFPLRRHLDHGVRVALGSDVGGGTGFSLLKEGLMAYQGQMLLGSGPGGGLPLGPAHLLYLATRAGALALGLDDLGDFTPGRQADLVLLRPPEGGTLAEVLAQSPSAEASLGALFTLAREDSVREVFVAGEPLFTRLGLS